MFADLFYQYKYRVLTLICSVALVSWLLGWFWALVAVTGFHERAMPYDHQSLMILRFLYLGVTGPLIGLALIFATIIAAVMTLFGETS